MLDLYVFYILAPLIVISSLLIFPQKRLIRAVIALTAAFIGSALVFLLLGQTLIAILMLIIFVGGLSTYLIVAVATEEKNTKLVSLPYFAAVAVIFFAAISYLLLSYLPVQSSPVSSPSFLNAAALAFQSDYPTLYIVVILLFSVAIGGTLIIKKFARLIV